MACDVYRNDNALTALAGVPDRALIAEFLIEADGEVDVACRVAGVLRLANCAITRGSLVSEPGERTTLHAEMEGLSLNTIENLLRKLSQLICVSEVQARVTDPALGAAIRVLRMTKEGIISRDCPAQPPASHAN